VSRSSRCIIAAKRRCGPILPADSSTVPTAATRRRCRVLQSGLGRAVAVSRKRMSVMPDVPSFTEQGATSRIFQLTGFQCCAVPAGTPAEIVQKLSKLFVAGGKSERVQQVMKSFGVDDTAMTFEETQKLYKEESPVWLEAVASLGLAPS